MIYFFIWIDTHGDNDDTRKNTNPDNSKSSVTVESTKNTDSDNSETVTKLDKNSSETGNTDTEAKDKSKDSKEGSEIYKLVFFINILFQNKKSTLPIICKISEWYIFLFE